MLLLSPKGPKKFCCSYIFSSMKFLKLYFSYFVIQFTRSRDWIDPLREQWRDGSVLKRQWILVRRGLFALSEDDSVDKESNYTEYTAIRRITDEETVEWLYRIENIDRAFLATSLVFVATLVWHIVSFFFERSNVESWLNCLVESCILFLILSMANAFVMMAKSVLWNENIVRALLIAEDKIARSVDSASRVRITEETASLIKMVGPIAAKKDKVSVL